MIALLLRFDIWWLYYLPFRLWGWNDWHRSKWNQIYRCISILELLVPSNTIYHPEILCQPPRFLRDLWIFMGFSMMLVCLSIPNQPFQFRTQQSFPSHVCHRSVSPIASSGKRHHHCSDGSGYESDLHGEKTRTLFVLSCMEHLW